MLTEKEDKKIESNRFIWQEGEFQIIIGNKDKKEILNEQ